MGDRNQVVRLSVPAEAGFARTVRMMAASLGAACDMGLDDVEDLRMAAEEGFVYSCATRPEVCDITFALSARGIAMDFSLGAHIPEDDADSEQSLGLVELLLSAICEDFSVSEDGSALRLIMSRGE